MKKLIYNGMELKLQRAEYVVNDAIYIGAQYFDEDCQDWLPYGDVSVNIEFLNGMGKAYFAVKNYEDFGRKVVDMIKEEYDVDFVTEVAQGYGTFNIYHINNFEKFCKDIPVIK